MPDLPHFVDEDAWKPISQQLGVGNLLPITNNPRSPFYKRNPQDVLALFIECNASVAAIPEHPGIQGETTEGYVLFRRQQPVRHYYVPLQGAIVFFTERGIAIESTSLASRGGRVTIEDLLLHARYEGSVGPGQNGGLLEFLLLYMQRVPKDSKDFDQQAVALRTTHLHSVAGKWILSGFAATNSLILRVPASTITAFIQRQKMVCGIYREWFLLRCTEELAYRQSQHYFRLSLSVRGEHSRVLAGIIFDHAQRNHKRHIIGTQSKVAWYLQDTSIEFARLALNDLTRQREDGPPILQKRAPNSDYYSFNRRRLLHYYLNG